MSRKPSAIVPTKAIEPEEISGSPAIKKLSNKRLAIIVIAGFQKIRKCLPYIVELRQRFADLPRGGANIMGCTNWTTFCITHLHRTDRAIRYALAEQNEIRVEVTEQRPVARPVKILVSEHTYSVPTHAYIHPSKPLASFPGNAEVTRDVADTAERDVAETATRIGDRDAAAKRNARNARTWLAKMIVDFEELNLASVEPEEMQNMVDPPGFREILLNCAAWLQKVCEVTPK